MAVGAALATGRKRRAETDRLDARHLRDLLIDGRLPESWIPPEHILEHYLRRGRVRRAARVDRGELTCWWRRA